MNSIMLYLLIISQTLHLAVCKAEQQQWASLAFQIIILICTIILAVIDFKYRRDIT